MTLAAGDSSIETDRLILRRMTAADRPFYERIQADPEVARYIGLGRPRTPEETAKWLENMLLSYEATGLGQLAVTLRSDGSLLGRCGLSYVEIEQAVTPGGAKGGYYFPEKPAPGVAAALLPELGYTFDRAAWGKGYAREAAGAVHRYAVRTLQRGGIISLIHDDNARSLKLAKSFGATHVDRVVVWGRTFGQWVWPDA